MSTQDVYSEIAALVRAQVQQDIAKGLPEALVLQDNVDRKLVKQTVMTSVYGVTFVGARHQISSRLSERGWDDEKLLYKTSTYGAKVCCRAPLCNCIWYTGLRPTMSAIL